MEAITTASAAPVGSLLAVVVLHEIADHLVEADGAQLKIGAASEALNRRDSQDAGELPLEQPLQP